MDGGTRGAPSYVDMTRLDDKTCPKCWVVVDTAVALRLGAVDAPEAIHDIIVVLVQLLNRHLAYLMDPSAESSSCKNWIVFRLS